MVAAQDHRRQALAALLPPGARAFDVVGLGEGSVDRRVEVDRVPRPGQKVEASGHALAPGGQVATAMLAAQRLGLRARYVGPVGNDEAGGRLRRALEAGGLAGDLVITPGVATRSAVVLVDAEGERTIVELRDPGCVLAPETLDRTTLCSARVLHIDATDVPAALVAAGWARDVGAVVSADVDNLTAAGPLLPMIDLLVASESVERELEASDDLHLLEALATRCATGATVCLTRGERGSVTRDAGGALIEMPAFAIDVVDTTGCGDVFRGALLAALLGRDASLEDALRFASAAAALSTTARGAQGLLPNTERVEAFLAASS